MRKHTLYFLYPLFLRPEKSTMAAKSVYKTHMGHILGMKTKVILLPDIPVIVKSQIKNVSLGCMGPLSSC